MVCPDCDGLDLAPAVCPRCGGSGYLCERCGLTYDVCDCGDPGDEYDDEG